MIHRTQYGTPQHGYVEYFDDDDERDRGRERLAYWYGPGAPETPSADAWVPAHEVWNHDAPDPFDLACERRCD